MEHLDEILERLQNKEKQLNIIDEIKKQDEQHRQNRSKSTGSDRKQHFKQQRKNWLTAWARCGQCCRTRKELNKRRKKESQKKQLKHLQSNKKDWQGRGRTIIKMCRQVRYGGQDSKQSVRSI